MKPTDRPLKVLQFTDVHLFDAPNQSLCGVNTDSSLRKVIQLAKRKSWPPDLVLVTGDLCQHATERSYRRFKKLFSSLKVPVYCLPGNHDDVSKMKKVLNGQRVRVGRLLKFSDWQILMLNTAVRGKNLGHLGRKELEFVTSTLSSNGSHHTLVCMHHNPVKMGSRWLDTMTVDNGPTLMKIFRKYRKPVNLLWGHVHQNYERRRGKIRMMATASTSIQFRPKSGPFKLDSRQPGYRFLALHPNGKIRTKVFSLSPRTIVPDLTAVGY